MTATATKRPHILFIMADQMAAPLLPLHDPASVVQMPHLSALAAQGVTFDSAYCNSPLCAPSRFSLVSGQLPSRIGGFDNAADLAADVPTYAHYLRNLGYRTALSGKMHFCGPDQLHGYEERLTSDIYPADYGGGELGRAGSAPELVPQHGLGAASRHLRAKQPARL